MLSNTLTSPIEMADFTDPTYSSALSTFSKKGIQLKTMTFNCF